MIAPLFKDRIITYRTIAGGACLHGILGIVNFYSSGFKSKVVIKYFCFTIEENFFIDDIHGNGIVAGINNCRTDLSLFGRKD